MSKKKKIIMISLAVTLALAVGVGGFVYAQNGFLFPHEGVGANKLIGVGEMGWDYYDDDVDGYWYQYQEWDTQFIVTNPNCEQDLTIEWVALIAGEDVYDYSGVLCWYAEDVIFEGTPQDWYDYTYGDIDIPGNEYSEIGVLSPHEVWQVSIAELVAEVWGYYPAGVIEDCELGKYTLEVTWSGASYSWWWRWGKVRPLTGWQKEKCWSEFESDLNGWAYDFPSFSISEAEMKNFESRTPFSMPEWWYPGLWGNNGPG